MIDGIELDVVKKFCTSVTTCSIVMYLEFTNGIVIHLEFIDGIVIHLEFTDGIVIHSWP